MERIPVTAKFIEFIREEMAERGWDKDRLSVEMMRKEIGIQRVALDFFFEGPSIEGLMFTEEDAEHFATGFGVSKEFIWNLARNAH